MLPTLGLFGSYQFSNTILQRFANILFAKFILLLPSVVLEGEKSTVTQNEFPSTVQLIAVYPTACDRNY